MGTPLAIHQLHRQTDTVHTTYTHTSIEEELDHLEVSLVAGEGESALLELIGVSVDVSSVVQQQFGHTYNTDTTTK